MSPDLQDSGISTSQTGIAEPQAIDPDTSYHPCQHSRAATAISAKGRKSAVEVIKGWDVHTNKFDTKAAKALLLSTTIILPDRS